MNCLVGDALKPLKAPIVGVPPTSGKKEGGCGDKRGWYGFCARSGEVNVKANESACFDVLDFEYFECLFLDCGYLVDVMGAKMVMGVVMGVVLEVAVTVFSGGLEVVPGDWVELVLLLSFVRRWMLEVMVWLKDEVLVWLVEVESSRETDNPLSKNQFCFIQSNFCFKTVIGFPMIKSKPFIISLGASSRKY